MFSCVARAHTKLVDSDCWMSLADGSTFSGCCRGGGSMGSASPSDRGIEGPLVDLEPRSIQRILEKMPAVSATGV